MFWVGLWDYIPCRGWSEQRIRFGKVVSLVVMLVYYDCLGLGDPLALKSPRAQCLFAHLRHLWLLPALPLDRLLLAGSLAAYLDLAHYLDTQDCAYFRVQLHS